MDKTAAWEKICFILSDGSDFHKYEMFVNVLMEATAECIPTKLRANHIVPWETAVKKKRDDMKTAPQCNQRDPTNAKAQKLKRAQSELIHT